MKKLIMLIPAAAAACAAFFAAGSRASALEVRAEGLYADDATSIKCEFDADGDKINDSYLVMSPIGSNDGIITRLFTRAENVTVPETVTVQTVSGIKSFSPSSLICIFPENGQDLKSVTVPKNITSISAKAFGYSSGGKQYDRNTAPAVSFGEKLPGFKIICPGGSAAARYAENNGFEAVFTDTPVSALGLKAALEQTEFSYTGKAAEPRYTLRNGSSTASYSGTYRGSDFDIVYRDNINAGTGKLVAVGKGDYSGELVLAEFKIAPINISGSSDLRINAIFPAEFTGSPVLPIADITYMNRKLVQGTDFYFSATDNIRTGPTRGYVHFKGNYTGSLPIEFNIQYAPINNFTATATDEGVALRWDPIKYDMILIMRSDNGGTSSIVGTLRSGSSYLDKKAPSLSNCAYTVMAMVTVDGKSYSGTTVSATVLTKAKALDASLTIGNGKLTVNWNIVGADGYVVTMDGEDIYDTNSASVSSFTKTGVKNYERHQFTVKPYTTTNGSRVYGTESAKMSTLGVDSILNSARTSNTTSFGYIDRQGSVNKESTVKLSDNDINILKRFADEHFTSDMTDAEKLEFTLDWINRNTRYASTADDWKKIGSASYADAIFNYKLGQCAQYNGAMVSMMRYLGYDADLIVGYRGTVGVNQWQHLWGEVEIDGLRYLIETGNYGKSGSWSFLLVPYERADGKYIQNGKNIPLASFNDYNEWGGGFWWWW